MCFGVFTEGQSLSVVLGLCQVFDYIKMYRPVFPLVLSVLSPFLSVRCLTALNQ